MLKRRRRRTGFTKAKNTYVPAMLVTINTRRCTQYSAAGVMRCDRETPESHHCDELVYARRFGVPVWMMTSNARARTPSRIPENRTCKLTCRIFQHINAKDVERYHVEGEVVSLWLSPAHIALTASVAMAKYRARMVTLDEMGTSTIPVWKSAHADQIPSAVTVAEYTLQKHAKQHGYPYLSQPAAEAPAQQRQRRSAPRQ